MKRRTGVLLLSLWAAAGCSHHHLHHAYNEPHEHNQYNTPDHPSGIHEADDHRDVTHEHEHFGGNEG